VEKYKHQEMNAYLIWTVRDQFGCVTDIVKEMMNTWNAEDDFDDPFNWNDADDRDLVTYRLAKACEADAYILTDSIDELVKACSVAKKNYRKSRFATQKGLEQHD
jgi:hypothetical protein